MYRAKIKQQNRETQALLESELPISGLNPDDFIETYDESGEFIDIHKAFKVNAEGFTPEEELRILNDCAATMDDPRFVESTFKLLKNGWVSVSEEEVESVVWRRGEMAFCFEYDKNAAIADKSVPYSWV